MKARKWLWLWLVVCAGGGATPSWADTGWMQPGVRIWYFGGAEAGGPGTSNATEAYLIRSVTGTDVLTTRHSALSNWTAPLPVEHTSTPVLGMGPAWIHPLKLQTLAAGELWKGQPIYLVERGAYTYDTFPYHFLPIKALFDIRPQRQIVKISYRFDLVNTGNAFFDAETGLLLYHQAVLGVTKVFFILAEINYDFARRAAFPEDNGPHVGFRSDTIETSQGNPAFVGGGMVSIQSTVETRYDATVEMLVQTTISSPTGLPFISNENYCFFGDVPTVRRFDHVHAANVPPEQWNPIGTHLWWWLPPGARHADSINVLDVQMVRLSPVAPPASVAFVATTTPSRFHFSTLWFDRNGYLVAFSARNPATGLHVQPTDFNFWNEINVRGRTYYRQHLSPDADDDGLPDQWEIDVGLDPNSAIGDDGPDGDPDGDGRTNLEEYLAGTHPRGFHTRYLAEGATGIFRTRIALMNPGQLDAIVLLRFLTIDQERISRRVTLPPMTRSTVDVQDIPGLASTSFSTVIESDEIVIADRTMSWGEGGYGSHAESSIISPATRWYLAEGATHSNFDLYYLFQNPHDLPTEVTVRYLLPEGRPPIERTYSVPAASRFNIHVNLVPGLGSTDVSAEITSTRTIIVERAMYQSRGGEFFTAGHNSAAVTTASSRWFLAEGATGALFDLYLLIANPNPEDVTVDATYMLEGGYTIDRAYIVRGNSRRTIFVDGEDPYLAITSVSTIVQARHDMPIIVERAMWWPGDYTTWEEAHNSFGTTGTATTWAMAEGEVGGPANTQTYILIANTSTFPGEARVTLVFEDGTTSQLTVPLAPSSRQTVPIHELFAGVEGRRFGAIVESLPQVGSPAAQIVVERAMYSDAQGRHWAAGTNAVATEM